MVLEKSATAETTFDQERLDVDRLSIEHIPFSCRIAKSLSGVNRPARDPRIRAAQSMPLNIAEGEAAGETRAAAYGRREDPQDSNRIFEIARGSALQRSSIRDARRVCDATDDASDRRGKSDCKRIVPLLTRLIHSPCQNE